MNSGVVSSIVAQNNTLNTNAGYSTYENPALRGPRPFDPKRGLEYDIEMERFKLHQMETRFRSELEAIRFDHQKIIEQSEQRHKDKRKMMEEEKALIAKEKAEALEEAKKKMNALQKIDIENRDLLYKKNLDNQRQLYEDQ